MINKRISKNLFLVITFIMDIGIIFSSYYLLLVTHIIRDFSVENLEAFNMSIPYIIIINILLFFIYNLYDMPIKTIEETIIGIFLSIVMSAIFTMAIAFFVRGFSFPRIVIFLASFIQLVCIILWRTICYKVYNSIYQRQKAIIICNKDEKEDLVNRIDGRFNIIDIVDYNRFLKTNKYINSTDIVIISPSIKKEQSFIIYNKSISKNKSVYIIPSLYEIAMYSANINSIDDLMMLHLDNYSLSKEQRFFKRLMDIVLSLFILILTSPIIILVIIIIKLDSKGPIFYKQERVTINSKKFNVLKFRTMVQDAEKRTGPVLSTCDVDDRITTVGKFLRKTRIDELPQFINVLLGSMSIVGPRPERPYFIDKFRKDIPEFEYRLNVKAGITGLAQVVGKYSTKPEDKLRYDLLYINQYSLLLDIKIILQTVKVVFIKTAWK